MIAAHCDSSIRPPSFRSRWAGYCWVGWIGIMLIWPCLFARISVRSQSVCCWSIKNLWFQRQKDDLSQISKSGIWPRYPVVPPLLLSCSMLFYCSSLACVSCLAAVVIGLRSWGPVFVVWCWYLSWSAARIYTERNNVERSFIFDNFHHPCVRHDKQQPVVRVNPMFNMKTIHIYLTPVPYHRSRVWSLNGRLGNRTVGLSCVVLLYLCSDMTDSNIRTSVKPSLYNTLSYIYTCC